MLPYIGPLVGAITRGVSDFRTLGSPRNDPPSGSGPENTDAAAASHFRPSGTRGSRPTIPPGNPQRRDPSSSHTQNGRFLHTLIS
jgi:hypothetical protein